MQTPTRMVLVTARDHRQVENHNSNNHMADNVCQMLRAFLLADHYSVTLSSKHMHSSIKHHVIGSHSHKFAACLLCVVLYEA